MSMSTSSHQTRRFLVSTSLTGALAIAAALTVSSVARAADPPVTAEVLSKLHDSNQKEIAMGHLALKNASSKAVKSFGKTLVKDHSAADKKVLALAKREKIDLPLPKPAIDDDMSKATGTDFDGKFSKDMLDDHKKDVGEAVSARDATTDPKLKTLLTELVPTLQKHQETAQKLVDEQSGSGKK